MAANWSFAGNSGGPILRKSDLVAIGVHCYGGSPNSGTPLGPNGQKVEDYIKALELAKPNVPGVQFVRVGGTESGEEKFRWKSIGKVLGPVVSTGLTATGFGAVASVGKC
jgi:hypothetical protein